MTAGLVEERGYAFEIRHHRLWRHRLHRPTRRRRYLASHYKGDAGLKWALAGHLEGLMRCAMRSARRDLPLIVADAGDAASLKAMVEQAKSVITTVGPYQLYGEGLLAALVFASGTDYLDLCGEPVWMRQMIDKYEAAAKTGGARIVFSCGFDSVPFRTRHLLRAGRGQARIWRAGIARQGRVRDMRGTLSGGTAASAKATFDAVAKDLSLVAILNNPLRIDTLVRRAEAAARQQAAVRGRPAIMGRSLHDGVDQHSQRPSLQYADGLPLRSRLRL